MKLPQPYVRKTYRQELVDLQPGGATVAITTRADNPLTERRFTTVEPATARGVHGVNPYLKVGPRVSPRKNYWRPGVAGAVTATAPATMAFIPGLGQESSAPWYQGMLDFGKNLWGQVGPGLLQTGQEYLHQELIGPPASGASHSGGTASNGGGGQSLVSYPPPSPPPAPEGVSTNTVLLVGGGLAAVAILAVALSGRRR